MAQQGRQLGLAAIATTFEQTQHFNAIGYGRPAQASFLSKERVDGIEQIVPIQDASVDALIRERLWSDLSGHSCLQSQSDDSRYLLSLQMTVTTDLPTPLAGWIGLEIEGLNEVLRPRRGREPVLVSGHAPLSYRLDDESGVCETPYEFKDPVVADAARECVLGKRRFRPVLICDREAAHYWQLPSYWDGQIPGNWTTGKT